MSENQLNHEATILHEWRELEQKVSDAYDLPPSIAEGVLLPLLETAFQFAKDYLPDALFEAAKAKDDLDEAVNVIRDLQQESAAYERGKKQAFAEVLAELENLRGVLLATEVEGLTGASVSARQANLIAHGYRTMAEIAKLAGLATAQEGIKMLPPDKLRRKCEMWEQGVAKMLPRFQRLMSTSQQSLDAWRDLTNLRDRVNEIK